MEAIREFDKITDADLTKWAQTKGQLTEVTIPVDESEDAKFVLCKPTKDVMDAMESLIDSSGASKVNELLEKNCILGGDFKYIESGPFYEPSVYLTIIEQLGKYMRPKAATSRKL